MPSYENKPLDSRLPRLVGYTKFTKVCMSGEEIEVDEK